MREKIEHYTTAHGLKVQPETVSDRRQSLGVK